MYLHSCVSTVYRNPAHWALTLTRTFFDAVGIWLLFPLCFSRCKKDDQSGPTNYRLTVVDEWTGERLADAPIILEEYGGGNYRFDTLGYTDDSGFFEYEFNEQPLSGQQGYRQYNLHCLRTDYYKKVYPTLHQDHETHEVTLDLVKKAVLCFKATRIGLEDRLTFLFHNEMGSPVNWSFNDMSVGESRTHYETVPSNRTTTIHWSSEPNPYAPGSPPFALMDVPCGYGDTTLGTLDF